MPTPRIKAETSTRAAAVKALLADPWGCDVEMDDERLAAFTPAERKILLHDVEREEWRRREEARLPVLLERLATWDPCQWGSIFAEMPDLEQKLTPERKREWAAWLRQVREEREKNGTGIHPTEQ